MSDKQSEEVEERVGEEDIGIEEQSPQQIAVEDKVEREVTVNHQSETQQDQQSRGFVVQETESKTEETCMSYGNNVVIFKVKKFAIFVGPDYLCFIPTFIIFTAISYLMVSYIDATIHNAFVQILTRIVCWGQCLSYLAVALSDPGVARPVKQIKDGLNRTVFCRKCRFQVLKRSYHCPYCDICIEGYDHHCPWTSKCIGRNNLKWFYVFLIMTPIYIVYCAFAFGFTIQESQPNNSHLRVAPRH